VKYAYSHYLSYLPDPSHRSQSGHLTGFGGGSSTAAAAPAAPAPASLFSEDDVDGRREIGDPTIDDFSEDDVDGRREIEYPTIDDGRPG